MLGLWTLRILGVAGGGASGWWISIISDLSSSDGRFLPWGLVFIAAGLAGGGLIAQGGVVLARGVSEMPGARLVARLTDGRNS